MATRLLVCLLLLLVTACVPPETTVTLLGKTTYPSKDQNCEIQILTELPKNRKFEEIAILNTIATGQANAPLVSIFTQRKGKDLNAMLPGIKAAACKLGADAVLIKNVEPGLQYNHESFGKAYTVAIKFLD